MQNAKLAWGLLTERTGKFQGKGVNHEKQDFTGNLLLETAVPGKMLCVRSSATGNTGEVFHDEVSWIGFDISGELVYHVSSNNHPAVVPHKFDRLEEKDDARHVVFRFGNPDDRQSFREEITFSFFQDGSVAHHYAWGLPGGNFEPRSGSRMNKLG